MSTELWILLQPCHNKRCTLQFFNLKNIIQSVIPIILFVIKNGEYLSSSSFNFDCRLFLYVKTAQKQYSGALLLCVHTLYNPFAHPSCTSLLFILLFIKPQYTVFCTSYCLALFIPLHILLLFLFFYYIYALVLLLLYNFYFILLHCPLSGPDFTYISLLIIPCIIYYVKNKGTLNPWTLKLKKIWKLFSIQSSPFKS